MISRGVLLGLVFCFVEVFAELRHLNVDFSWRYVEFQFDNLREEADAIQSGAYYFRMNVPYDVEVAPDGRIFVTIVRKDGVPASLTTITSVMGEGGGPLLRPYPNWSWTNVSNCDSIISVHRIAQDECNRLWVLDAGRIESTTLCSPKLLVFNLTTDELIDRVNIPLDLATNASGDGMMSNLVLDTLGPNCEQTNVYMADTWGGGLVIYNGKSLWRIESPYFKPNPDAEDFSVRGVDLELKDGLLGMALTRDDSDVSGRLLYFRPLSSYDMYYTRVEELHSKKNDRSSIQYYTEPAELESQSIAMAFSSQGVLFFSQATPMSIVCWNCFKPFTTENIVTVSDDHKTLQWASGMKVLPSSEGETLWVLTNRYQNEATNKMNYTRTNFRILSGNVEELIRGTNCEL